MAGARAAHAGDDGRGSFVVPAPPRPALPVIGSAARFPVRRIYCVGRNFADHAREMGANVPDARGEPVFFLKPADALVPGGGDIPYPPGTGDLHHEVELVVALGTDAPEGILDAADAHALVFGYGIGLDLTRRDLQARAKAGGLPWDTGKSFDHAAPASGLLPANAVGALPRRTLSLDVNGALRQRSTLDNMIWNVADILVALSKLYALRAGDLVFMGTPAGVGPLQPGDAFRATLDDLLVLEGRIVPPR
jgi:2-keto-4-pentenoate hydratase/2-oxohepta-3-ene-1,7-dioic acid hydratase in catechol pathway